MRYLKKVLIAVALFTSACTSGIGDGGAGGGFGGSGSIDETSLAFFQETIGDRVFFVVNQSNLSSGAMTVLDAQSAWLASNPELDILIEGHADERGTREYNLALGARRANSVREYLVTTGIPDARIRVVTFGKERPVAICSEESCWTQNRRAVTVVAGGLAS